MCCLIVDICSLLLILKHFHLCAIRKFLTPRSSKSLTIHVTSTTTAAIALYSASELDLETVPYFLDIRDIGDFPWRRM